MARQAPLQQSSDAAQAALASSFKAVSLIGLIVFALVWLTFGCVAFVQIHQWDIQYDQKMKMIECGEVKPDNLDVQGLFDDAKAGVRRVTLAKNGKAVAWRSINKAEGLRVGESVPAYAFGEDYIIPRFDRGGFHWGKWVFLGFGLFPLVVIGCVALVKVLLGRRRSSNSSGQSSGPLDSPRQLPKAFSQLTLSFERMPDDAQLMCLLGDPVCGPIRAVEESGSWTARPWQFPMRYVVPWMIFVALVITGFLCFGLWSEHQKQNFHFVVFFGVFLVLLWFLALPCLLGMLAFINRLLTKKGDFFRVDLTSRTLELCRLGRTVRASEIVAITLLTRWFCSAGSWSKTHQTGVLIRLKDGRIELCPLVRELGGNVRSSKRARWAERLAGIFQIPVRQIELSRSESRELKDC